MPENFRTCDSCLNIYVLWSLCGSYVYLFFIATKFRHHRTSNNHRINQWVEPVSNPSNTSKMFAITIQLLKKLIRDSHRIKKKLLYQLFFLNLLFLDINYFKILKLKKYNGTLYANIWIINKVKIVCVTIAIKIIFYHNKRNKRKTLFKQRN